jgi:uncharacterized membrane protein
MKLQHMLTIAVVATGLLVPAVAQAEARACRAVALPAPAGTFSTVNGGDLTGRYLVGRVNYPDRSAGALWRHGRFTEIDASSLGGVQVEYHDVNRHGVVVGERMTDFGSFHTDAFTYRRGTFTLLPALRAGESTEALGINSRGDVVGNSIGNGFTPVVWPANRPSMVRALGPAGSGRAMGIDEDGSVVGYLAPFPPGTPYLWPATGTPRPLPDAGQGGNAVAIQRGMVAGNVFDPATGMTVPASWNLRTGGFRMFPDAGGSALSVNRKGTVGVVGALVHKSGRVAPVGGWVNTVADTGVAAGTTDQFSGRAVRWLSC